MKKFTLLLFSIIILSLSLVSCSKDKTKQANTPTKTALLVKQSIDNKNYEAFKNLFSDGLENSISKEDFEKLQNLTTAGSDYKLYSVITFENGEIFLIKLTSTPIDDDYKIEEVMQVPDEFKTLFNTK
ncbi:hypothetical protein [Clostridium tertium]|uniref:DUF4878 domain-containing protein n=1 Tax=Clostridium tertium TaxID=1559 RepID=A0A6N3G2P4_9CLOT